MGDNLSAANSEKQSSAQNGMLTKAFYQSTEGDCEMLVSFDDWTRGRKLVSWGTNAGAEELPFQKWKHFKEAFAPELIARAVSQSKIPVKTCVDPFGGSGTTALSCQFLGVRPETIEVNPFLADLIEAKLTSYNADLLARDLGSIIRSSWRKTDIETRLAEFPPTFVEPGIGERWIFDRAVAERICAFIGAIELLGDASHRRLFKVLLGGILVEVSNIIVNGKGRRYRRGWETRRKSAEAVSDLFVRSAQRAIEEIHKYTRRACAGYELKRGDSRQLLQNGDPVDLCVFSPPYPNSFDYTDVYNVELWVLGYLNGSSANQRLRESTLSSHVQISREFAPPPATSSTLKDVSNSLETRRSDLWDSRIPQMVGAYFADMEAILRALKTRIREDGSVWMVVGDSRYSDVHIKTATILAELSVAQGWIVEFVEPCRSMRASAQQGGQFDLSEDLLVLTNGG